MANLPTSKPEEYELRRNGDTDAYRLAFDESIRTLELLDKRSDTLRTGYVAVLAFAGSSTAFLAGTVLTTSERNSQLQWMAFFATLSFLLSLGLAVFDLWPRKRHGGIDATPLVEYIEKFDAAYNLTLANLARQNAGIAKGLRSSIRRVSVRFACFLTFSSASILIWVALAWLAEPRSSTP